MPWRLPRPRRAAGLSEKQKNDLTGCPRLVPARRHSRAEPARAFPHQRHFARPQAVRLLLRDPDGWRYDCHAVWSVNHEFDPISHVGGAFTGSWRPDRKEVRIQHFHEQNIHAFAHYLSHPAVHCEFFRLLLPAFSGACYQEAQTLSPLSPCGTGSAARSQAGSSSRRTTSSRSSGMPAQLDRAPTKAARGHRSLLSQHRTSLMRIATVCAAVALAPRYRARNCAPSCATTPIFLCDNATRSLHHALRPLRTVAATRSPRSTRQEFQRGVRRSWPPLRPRCAGQGRGAPTCLLTLLRNPPHGRVLRRRPGRQYREDFSRRARGHAHHRLRGDDSAAPRRSLRPSR